MYCKKCHTLLEDSSAMCPNCYYDNNLDVQNDVTMELKAVKIEGYGAKPKVKIRPITIVILVMIIIASLVIIYMINDRKDINNKKITTTMITTTKENVHYNTFSFKNLSLKYSDNFGSSSNTIFYKNNTDISIEIVNITEEEYNNITNVDEEECLTSKIGEIETKTIAGDDYYNHLFKYNEEYYNITVHFINDDDVYDGNIQMEIAKILDSIEAK